MSIDTSQDSWEFLPDCQPTDLLTPHSVTSCQQLAELWEPIKDG